MSGLISEADLMRARVDPQFRQELMAQSLELLLAALNRVHRGEETGPDTARQMSEGTTLALDLADRLQKLEGQLGPRAA